MRVFSVRWQNTTGYSTVYTLLNKIICHFIRYYFIKQNLSSKDHFYPKKCNFEPK